MVHRVVADVNGLLPVKPRSMLGRAPAPAPVGAPAEEHIALTFPSYLPLNEVSDLPQRQDMQRKGPNTVFAQFKCFIII